MAALPTEPNVYESTAADDANVSTYDASESTLEYDTDTVEGRVEGLIAKNSAPMRQNAARSKQAMEGRGLLNSSMAVGAGQAALYDYALPIASQDANASIQNKQFNVGEKNLASQFNSGEENKFGLLDIQGKQSLEQIGASGLETRQNLEAQGAIDLALMERKNELDQILITATGDEAIRAIQEQGMIDMELQISANQNNIDLQGMSNENAQALAVLNNEYQILLQGSRDAMLVYTNHMSNVTDILNNGDLTPEAKDVLVAAEMDLLRGGLDLLGGITNIDWGDYFGYDPNPITPTTPTPPTTPGTGEVSADTYLASMPATISDPDGRMFSGDDQVALVKAGYNWDSATGIWTKG